MKTGIIYSIAAVVLSIFGCVAQADPDIQPATRPVLNPTEPALPDGAIRRLGDLRFADPGARDGFFSADSKQLITYGSDLTVWDIKTGWMVTRYRVPNHFFSYAAPFGSGQVAVVCTAINQPSDLLVFNPLTGAPARQIDKSWKGGIEYFAAAADGSRFAVVADHILLCDGITGKVIRDLGPLSRKNNSPPYVRGNPLGFSTDAKIFVYTDADGRAHVADAQTGSEPSDRTYLAAHGVALRGDGKILAIIAEDQQLHLIDITTGENTAIDPIEIQFNANRPPFRLNVLSVAFAGSTGLLTYACNAPGGYVIDTNIRPIPKPRQIHSAGGIGARIITSANGETAAITSDFGRWSICNLQTEKPISPDGFGMKSITAMAVSPDGKELIVGNSNDQLFRWDLAGGQLLKQRDSLDRRGMSRPVRSLAYVDGGKSLFERGSAQVRYCDPTSLESTRLVQDSPQGPYAPWGGIIFSSDGRWRAEMHDQDLVLVDSKTSTEKTLQHNLAPGNSALLHPSQISPDGSLMHASTSYGPRFMDLQTLQLGPVLVLGPKNVGGYQLVRFSPNSRWVIIQMDLTIALCDARTLVDAPATQQTVSMFVDQHQHPVPAKLMSPLWSWNAPDNFGLDAAFSATSEMVAITTPITTDAPGGVNLIETRTGSTIVKLPASSQKIITACFVPRHSALVTADQAGTVLVWDFSRLLPTLNPGRSDEQLWNQLSLPDAAAAYAAGVELLRRHKLEKLAQTIATLQTLDVRGNTDRIRQLIGQLSAPDSISREKAHKALEGSGPAAISAIRAALSTHPGGELEDRLNDIAHVIGADDPNVPAAPVPVVPLSSPAPELLRTLRTAEILGWSDESECLVQAERLKGPSAPTTKP